MRVAVVATVICLSIVGLAEAQSAKAAMRVPTSIPAQGLGPALKVFAQSRDLQVLYFSKTVRDIRTGGASGDLTADEALTQLLSGTGLIYRYVDAKAVTILPTGTEGGALPAKSDDPNGADPRAKEGKKSSSDGFRTARVDQGGNSQTSTVRNSPSIPQESTKNVQLEEIVVTAQKREERLKEVPISVAVLTGKELDTSSVSGVSEALSLIPGVSATAGVQGGGTQIVMRGVGAGEPLFNGTSPIGYYLDAVPFGLVKSAVVPDAGVYDLERIEVLRGPQGTLYGANAENGLIRVLTHDADLNHFELKARALTSVTEGGEGNYGGDLAVNLPLIDDKLAVRAVVDYANTSGWINSPVESHINDAELRTYRLKIAAQPADNLSIAASAWSTHDSYGGPSTSTSTRTTQALLPEPIVTRYNVYDFKTTYDAPYFSVSSSSSYLNYRNQGVLDLEIYDIPLKIPAQTSIYAHVFAEEVLFNSKPGAPWTWTAGGFYRNGADELYTAIPGLLAAPGDFTSGSSSYAGFGQVGRRFLDDKWELTLGLRGFHDDVLSREHIQSEGLSNVPLIHQTASFNATTPRAVLTWYPVDNRIIYASYSEGFRSGALQDPSTLHIDPNLAPLRPDHLHNYEVGAKSDLFGGLLSFDSAFYYIVWNGVQQSIVLPLVGGVGTTALVNGKSASGPGVDLALTARPVDGLQLGVAFSWNDLTMDAPVNSAGALLFVKGDRLNYSSEFTGGVSAAYSHALGSGGFTGRFSVSAHYGSRQKDHAVDNGVAIVNVGEAQFNSRVALSLLSPTNRWTTIVYADNLTNNYGASPQSLFPTPDLSPRPRPRTVGAQVDFHL